MGMEIKVCSDFSGVVSLPREHLEHAILWLRAAIECPTWHWDQDQLECARLALADAERALQ